MFHGWGHDGAGAGTALGESIAAATLLRHSTGVLDSGDDGTEATEALEPTVWTPAPGAVVVLPERYTPGYAYPALIWLMDGSEAESPARQWLSEISTRNFVGIGLRPELYTGGTIGMGDDPGRGRQRGLSRFDSLQRSLESWVRIHPQRRYVVGRGTAATAAIGWLLGRPDCFAGAVAIDAPPANMAAWHAASRLATGRRLLWLRSQPGISADFENAELLALSCLGLEISTQMVDNHARTSLSMGDQINHWVLDAVPTTIRD